MIGQLGQSDEVHSNASLWLFGGILASFPLVAASIWWMFHGMKSSKKRLHARQWNLTSEQFDRS
jgi:hypothetical protein